MNEADFNPADYAVIEYLDNQRPRYCGQGAAAYAEDVKHWEETIAHYFPGWRNASPSIHHCGHCGNGTVRYITAVEHLPTGKNVVFGSECVHKLQFANADELKAAKVRAKAEQGNARLSTYLARLEFLSQFPELAAFIEANGIERPEHANNAFARDILRNLNHYGSLTARQIETLMSSLQKDVERFNRPVVVPTAPAPEGRQTVEGKIVHTKAQESMYGMQFKMLVLLDSGAKVWSTIPTCLPWQDVELKGQRVKFTATFERSKDDQFFSFAKRPTKAALVVADAAKVSA